MKKLSLYAIVLFSFATLLFMIASQVQAAAGPVQGDSADSCALPVTVLGRGRVTVQRDGAQAQMLDKEGANRAAASCGETLQLTAVAAPMWRFDTWQLEGAPDHAGIALSVRAPQRVTAVFVPREMRTIPLAAPIYDRSGELINALPVYASLWESGESLLQPAAAQALPQLAFWYGTRQPAGLPGLPQKWVDVLGNVTFDGSDPLLRYKLNGGAYIPLNFGGNGSVADGRRLYEQGDFVINLDVADLQEGNNIITVRATDSTGSTAETIVVEYTSGQTWPIPANVDWDQTGSLLDVSAVIDGQWELTPAGDVRTVVTGYDRVLAVGDISWTSYEAIVPVTIHSYSSAGFQGINFAPAVGVVMGWQGHTDNPIVCDQPKCGWLPLGMATWYEWDKPDTGAARFKMWVKHTNKTVDPSGLALDEGKEYLWKVQVNRGEGANGTYRLKVWEAGAAEPANWLMVQSGTVDSQASGSLMLLAHHVDVTFGDVKIRPLNGDFAAPIISNVNTSATETSATITWDTNEPATGEVVYFKNPGDKKTVLAPALGTSHSVVLEQLQPGTTYTVEITAEDEALNRSAPAVTTVTTAVEKFLLRVTTIGFGSVQVNPDKPSYDLGEQVTLTATPNGPLWLFAGWSGDASGSQNPLTIVISKDTTIQAQFKKTDNYLPFIIGNN